MHKKWTTILFLTFTITAWSAPKSLDCPSTSPLDDNLSDISKITNATDNCPAPSEEQRDELCEQLTKRLKETDEDGIQTYLYNKSILKLSCTSEEDENYQLKVKRMWNKHWKMFSCNLVGFNLENKNILKYAVKMTFDDFLYDLIKTYDVNLDQVDPADNKTVFEFCSDEIKSKKQEIPPDPNKISSLERTCKLLNDARKPR